MVVDDSSRSTRLNWWGVRQSDRWEIPWNQVALAAPLHDEDFLWIPMKQVFQPPQPINSKLVHPSMFRSFPGLLQCSIVWEPFQPSVTTIPPRCGGEFIRAQNGLFDSSSILGELVSWLCWFSPLWTSINHYIYEQPGGSIYKPLHSPHCEANLRTSNSRNEQRSCRLPEPSTKIGMASSLQAAAAIPSCHY